MISFRTVLMMAAALSLGACAPEAAVAPQEAATDTAAPVVEPAAALDVPATWTAVGQEPGWILTIENGHADFLYAYGEQNHTAVLAPPAAIEGGHEYTEGPGGLAVTVLSKPCADAMSGLPYPETVIVALGDETFEGCGGDTETLLAGEWKVETIQGERLAEGSSVTMVFDTAGDSVGGSTGCNNYGAPYVLTGEGLTFSSPFATEMACAEPLMTQERGFLTALAGIAMFAVDEDGALLLDGHNGERITARR